MLAIFSNTLRKKIKKHVFLLTLDTTFWIDYTYQRKTQQFTLFFK